jgi:hypothetical protein
MPPRKRTATATAEPTEPTAAAPDGTPPPEPEVPDLEVTPRSPGTLWDADVLDGLTAEQLAGLDLLRQPLPAHLIGKKPIGGPKKQSGRYPEGTPMAKCEVCHGYLPRDHQHLDFAGHAAVTERFLAADPAWMWTPVADPAQKGLPTINSGMWIYLTICGVTRLGFGDAGDNSGGNGVKEMIGDALRNAGMRFGVGLELWHKGDLHPAAQAGAQDSQQQAQRPADSSATAPADQARAEQDRAAEQAPGDPSEVTAQAWVERMVGTQSLAVTTAMMRDAGLAGKLQEPVQIPGQDEPVPLEEAFTRRVKWLRSQQQAPTEPDERQQP